jgi:cell division septal protein FtsQ
MGAAVAFVACALYAIARETPIFAITSVEVRGATPAVDATVRRTLASFEGRSLVSLHGAAVIRRAEDLPTVVGVTYDRAFPHTLRIRVVPERAVAVLRSGLSSWVVSARGRVIGSIDRSRLRRLPRIWLPPGARIDVGSFLDDDAGAAARALRQFVAAGFARRALWARLRDRQLTLGLRSGVELRLGPATNLALKTAIARGILPTLALPSAGGPTYLDVSVPERPVAGTNSQPEG